MLSMTGYGCACAEKDGRKLQAEIKSVNHRFLDIAPHYPRVLLFAEDRMKRLISARLKRGHVDLYLSYENTREDAKKVIPDLALAESYRQAATQICEACGTEPMSNEDIVAEKTAKAVRKSERKSRKSEIKQDESKDGENE